jgi:hypothetical protein
MCHETYASKLKNISLIKTLMSITVFLFNCLPDGRGKTQAQKDAEKKDPKLKTKGPRVVRHLWLIRHGQYELDDPKHGLTEMGRHQGEDMANLWG